MDAAQIEKATHHLAAAGSLCVLTGAGMSAESGIATFRDRDGVWSKFNPAELATPEAFRRDPVRVWDWYRLRRAQLREIEPHEGHRVLAEWERWFDAVQVVTQNVDGLHTRAGSSGVIELHGRLARSRCVRCEYTIEGLDDLGPDPRCLECGQRLRPSVVWFGEWLPPGAWEAAIEAASSCDVGLVIGTSGVVQPAASLTDVILSRGLPLIEINPNTSEISGRATVSIRAGCRDVLMAIDRRLRPEST